MNIKEKIINLDDRDYHMHTSTFSDWLSTIDEVVKFAWDIWLTEIAITDHSQASLEVFKNKFKIFTSWARWSVKRRENVYNDVKVIIWVEWDLLNEDWDFCSDIQWIESDFTILSAHKNVYTWDPKNITNAHINAIKRYHENIKFIAHPCNNADFWNEIDIKKLVDVANEYNIPLEFNAKNLVRWKTNIEKLHILLQNANKIYLNSDAHTLYELKTTRLKAIDFLKENWYI